MADSGIELSNQLLEKELMPKRGSSALTPRRLGILVGAVARVDKPGGKHGSKGGKGGTNPLPPPEP